jgi:hypothetical protein
MRGDMTIVFVDTSEGMPHNAKIRRYFENNYFPIMDLSGKDTSKITLKDSNKTKKKSGGIVDDISS